MAIRDLMPADTPDYMFDAWASCMSWAIGNPDIVQAFRDDTKIEWKPGGGAIDRMIDQATGADRKFIENFIRWANVAIWGEIDGPPAPAARENEPCD